MFDGITKVVYSSSGGTVAPKTFDDATATAEDQPVSMRLDTSVPGISKILGEFYSNYYSDRHGLPVSMVRFQNVYGPGGSCGTGRWRGSNTVWRNVTPTFVYKALVGEPIPVQNGGVATRDFIYVGDIARGLMARPPAGPADVYDMASGTETTIRELAETIVELAGSGAEVELAPAREMGPLRRVASATPSRRGRLVSRPRSPCARGSSDRGVDAREPRMDPEAASSATARTWRGTRPRLQQPDLALQERVGADAGVHAPRSGSPASSISSSRRNPGARHRGAGLRTPSRWRAPGCWSSWRDRCSAR